MFGDLLNNKDPEPKTISPFAPHDGVVKSVSFKRDANGDFHPMLTPIIKKENLATIATAALSLPYDGADPEFRGMTNAEVIYIRLAQAAAEGNLKAIDRILDRAQGKPTISSESKNLNVKASLEEYIASISDTPQDTEMEVYDVEPED